MKPRSSPGVIRLGAAGATVLCFLTLTACIATPVFPITTSDDMGVVLSQFVMGPEVTCEEMRDWFNVEYLPIVTLPDELGLEFVELWAVTPDEHLIHTWYIPAEEDRGTVIMSQGAVGTMPCYLFLARELVGNGYSVVLYNFRGFDRSPGVPDVNAMDADLEAVLDWTLLRTYGRPCTLMGVSLGTIPTIAVAVRRPEAVNAVILDSPLDLPAFIRRLGFALLDQTDSFISVLAKQLRSDELISSLAQPALFFLGEWDFLTTSASVENLYELAPGQKRMVRFPRTGHARGQFRDTERYLSELYLFLEEVWEQPVFEPEAAGLAESAP